jgi:hypothetical protein
LLQICCGPPCWQSNLTGASQDFLPQRAVIFAGPGFGFHRASISLLSARPHNATGKIKNRLMVVVSTMRSGFFLPI